MSADAKGNATTLTRRKLLQGTVFVLSAGAVGAFSGCSNAEEAAQELTVFAAASMTESLTELGAQYQAEQAGMTVLFNFDSSGILKTQIEEGAHCDVFLSASPTQMNQLDITVDETGNPDRLDFIASETRFDLLENKVVLAVAQGYQGEITSFDTLAQALAKGSVLLGMGNSDVPVGQYTQKILAYYGLDEAALATAGNISYGSNVKEVTLQVAEQSVTCGVLYATDAVEAGLLILDEATQEQCGQVIYPIAVTKNSAQPELAQSFVDYMVSDAGKTVLEGYGFTPLV